MDNDNNSPDAVQIKSYPWYLDDWFASETRASLNLAERGLYRELLDLCWYHGSLPTDLKMLRKLTQIEPNSFRKATGKVLACFHILDDGRYHHPKVDANRNRLERLLLLRRRSGQIGGLARASGQASAKASACGNTATATSTKPSSQESSEAFSCCTNRNVAPAALVRAAPVDGSATPLRAVLEVFASFGRGCAPADGKRCERAWAKLSDADRRAAAAHVNASVIEWRSRPTEKIAQPWNYLEGRHWERVAQRRQPQRELNRFGRNIRTAAAKFISRHSGGGAA